MSDLRRSEERFANHYPDRPDLPDRRVNRPEDARQATRRDQMGFQFLIELDEHLRPVGAWSTNLLDLSSTGCGLIQAGAIPFGSTYGVVFFRHGRWEAHLGEVAHIHAANRDWYRVGLRFVDHACDPQDLLRYVEAVFGFSTGVSRAS